MNSFSLLYIFVAFINYSLVVLAKNHYYIISIRRNESDIEYDKSTKNIQYAIDNFVNDRMNDIYNIIYENENTYTLDNGKKDSKLEELKLYKLEKRSNYRKRLIFKDRNRVKDYKTNGNKRSVDTNEVEEIEIESDLVSPICPILNYYAVRAYLSDNIVDIVKQIPNVIAVERSKKLKNASQYNYFDIKQIKKETHWSDVSVQENNYHINDHFTHLSILSQDKYTESDDSNYDFNYYYPSTAGKGIDVFLIDNGLWINNNDFDTYEGTKDQRTITCDAVISNGIISPTEDKSKCIIKETRTDRTLSDGSFYPEHGVMTSSVVGGTTYGVAKKANIHMIATEYETIDDLAAFDFIKQKGKPHKTVINISRSGEEEFSDSIQNKINELTDYGIIIFVAAGNDSSDCCEINENYFGLSKYSHLYGSYENVITVGALEFTRERNKKDISRAYYSNYGPCVDVYAPGKVIAANSYKGYSNFTLAEGTSFATPIVTGVAATLMSEHPEIDFTYQSMKKLLIDMSIKDVIDYLPSGTPNHLINNGKHTIYEPFKCNDPSGKYNCKSDCCGKNGRCVDIDSYSTEECIIENGCQTKYGKCLNLNYEDPKFTKEERKLVVVHRCKEELKPFEKCMFITVNRFYRPIISPDRIDGFCVDFRKYHCQNFYYEPYKYAPSCEEAQNYEYFTYLDREYEEEENIMMDNYVPIPSRELIINSLFCARDYRNGKEELCSAAKVLYTSKEEKFRIENCYSEECRQSYLEFVNYQIRSNERMGYRTKDLVELRDYLNSEECLSAKLNVGPKANSSTTTATSTTTTTVKTTSSTLPNKTTKTTTTKKNTTTLPKTTTNNNKTTTKKNTTTLPKTTTTTTTTNKTTTKKSTTTTTNKSTKKTSQKINSKTTKKVIKKTTKKVITKVKTTKIVNKNIPTSTVTHRCGPEFGRCAEPGTCCSKKNYCGKTNSYYGVNYQQDYDICK